MCQARSDGGIRCTAHAVASLNKAQNALSANTDPSKFPDLKMAVDKAQFDYYLTKEGISVLREQGREREATDFEDARARILTASKIKREKLRAQEEARLERKLDRLLSRDGVEELRIHGNDKLADKVQVHLERKMHSSAVSQQEHESTDTSDEATANKVAKPVRPVRPPSLGKAVALGALHGAIQGGKTGHGFRAGISAGTAQAKSANAKREQFHREAEQAQQAEDREKQQQDALEEKARQLQSKEDERLKAECLKWLRQKEKEEARIRREATTKRAKRTPTPSKQPMTV